MGGQNGHITPVFSRVPNVGTNSKGRHNAYHLGGPHVGKWLHNPRHPRSPNVGEVGKVGPPQKGEEIRVTTKPVPSRHPQSTEDSKWLQLTLEKQTRVGGVHFSFLP